MGPANAVLVRQLAGILFLADLAAYAPYARTCLGPGYWGKKNAWFFPIALVLWGAAATTLVLGVVPVIGAAVLWVLFRHFYVRNRWKNLFRGGGAPGFMSHWLVMYVLFFELASLLDGSMRLSESVRLMCNVDLGIILLCSGSYKALSGYMRGEGMEYGLANPFWGYAFRWFRKRRPTHFLFRAQDVWAPTAQIMTGIGLLIGAAGVKEARIAGAVLCILSFAYLLPTVRLGRLAVLMMAGPIWFLPELGFQLPEPFALRVAPLATPALAIDVLRGVTVVYIVLLPFVKAMQYLNLFGKIQLPGPIQRGLTFYADRFPIIMWRVFTPDVTNFFVRIYRVDRESKKETPLLHEDTTYSYKELGKVAWSARFLHVTESIALTTVFTTLKYFRSQRPLFEEKLRNYAHTLGQDGALLKFQYVSIMKGDERFEYVPIANFIVDLETDVIEEERLVPDFDYGAPAKFSHIKETIGYGSYVPKSSTRRTEPSVGN